MRHRRGGALALTPRNLDPDQCLILLHDKGSTVRWQPVSPTLVTHLRDHAEQRGAAASGGQLLRYTNGDPITTRRYDHLFTRLGNHLPWVATQQISIHWLRHTTLIRASRADACGGQSTMIPIITTVRSRIWASPKGLPCAC